MYSFVSMSCVDKVCFVEIAQQMYHGPPKLPLCCLFVLQLKFAESSSTEFGSEEA